MATAAQNQRSKVETRGVILALRLTALVFCVSVDELEAATRRKAPVALARQVAMYLVHVALGVNLTRVGRAFRRDRSTASYACQHVEELRDDPNFDHLLDCLEQTLRILNTQPRQIRPQLGRKLSLAAPSDCPRIGAL